MRQRIVYVIAVSFIFTGIVFITPKRSFVISGNNAVQAITPAVIDLQESVTQKEQEQQFRISKESAIAGNVRSWPQYHHPSKLQFGKLDLNLSYLLHKDQVFLASNSSIQEKLVKDQIVLPEEVYFPPGFRVSLLMQPNCLNIADRFFTLAEMDTNAKSLVENGFPAYVSAEIKEGLHGNQLIEALEKEKCVGSADPDMKEELSEVSYLSEPLLSSVTTDRILSNAGLSDLFGSMSYSDFGAATAKFGVVDSGIALNHPDLRAIVSGPMDDGGHGTKVAGVAAAPFNGIGTIGSMPFHVKVNAYKVNIPGTGSAYTSSISNGIIRAAYEGMDVINVSWSGFPSGSYSSAIATATAQGSFVVGAAGNFSKYLGSLITTPGSIVVGGLNATNSDVASYSNYGPGVELYTPGTYMTTTYTGGYALSTGTSFASPLAAGIGLMAKAWGRDRGYNFSPAVIKSMVLSTGRMLSTNRGMIRKLNPLAVYQYLISHYPGGGSSLPPPASSPWSGWGGSPAPTPTTTNPWLNW